MLRRIHRLAKLYGTNLRFTPAGSEENDPLDKAIKTGEKAERTPEEQAAIDKARAAEQQIEQERANAQRANEAARAAQDNLDAAKQETEDLKIKLEEAEAKAEAAGIENVELKEEDYEGTDLPIVQAIKAVKAELKAKDKEIAGLKKLASDYKEQDRKSKAQEAANSTYEELLSELDEEHGEHCRNDAVKMFNELIAKGEVKQGNPAKAALAMAKCYRKVKAAKKDKGESDVTLDPGTGGGQPPNLSGVEIKDGQSLDEAVEQIAAASKS